MDEARQVLERLERIDALRRDGARAAELLAEVRSLLTEGERWMAAEKLESGCRARAALQKDDGANRSIRPASLAAA